MFKKFTSVVVAIMFFLSMFMLTGCGDTKVIDGIEYDTYGILNVNSKRNDNIQYRTIIGNVVWSILLCETLVAPIYFIGFSLYEPVGVKKYTEIKGAIN